MIEHLFDQWNVGAPAHADTPGRGPCVPARWPQGTAGQAWYGGVEYAHARPPPRGVATPRPGIRRHRRCGRRRPARPSRRWPRAPWLRRSRAPRTRASSRGSKASPRSITRSTATCPTGGSTSGPRTARLRPRLDASRSSASGSRATATSTPPGAGYTAYMSDERRRGHERRARQGRPGRPDVPAVRLGQADQDDGLPPQPGRPDALHPAGHGADGPPVGRRRELRLRADARALSVDFGKFVGKFKAAMHKQFPGPSSSSRRRRVRRSR